jgi:hypothetical protein
VQQQPLPLQPKDPNADDTDVIVDCSQNSQLLLQVCVHQWFRLHHASNTCDLLLQALLQAEGEVH